MLIVLMFMCCTGFIPDYVLGQRPTGVITMVSEIVGGDGSWENPYIMDTNLIEWRVDDTYGAGKETATYKTELHTGKYRSCATQVQFDNLSWSNVVDRIFRWEGFTGTYHLDLVVSDDEGSSLKRIWLYCRVPPVKSYTLPYSPPAGNNKPNPVINILNAVNGAGTYNNPYKIDSPIVKFRIDGTYDPDGHNDVEYGAFLWEIHMHGHHPVYCKYEHEPDPTKTYIYYNEIPETIYEWDTREKPTDEYGYRLTLFVIDQYGEYNETNYRFIYDSEVPSPQPQLTVSTTTLNFGDSNETMTFSVQNTGSGSLSWSATENPDQSWITSIMPNNGDLNASAKVDVIVTVNRSNLADDEYSGTISVTSNGGNQNINVLINAHLPPNPPQNIIVVSP